jgi:hypothetical protein
MEEIDLSDTEPNHHNSKRKDSDRGADFDQISNDIGSDNEGIPNMENRLN